MPGPRRAISCILSSLEQSQVVNRMVAELLLNSAWESNQCVESWILSARRCASPRRFCCTTLCVILSTRWQTTSLCYDWLACHRESIVGWRPCFFWRAFFSILFRQVVHSLLFRRSVPGSTTCCSSQSRIQGWGEVTAVLVELCWNCARISYLYHNCIRLYLFFPVGIAVRTLLFGRIFEKSSKISVLFISAIKSCDSLLNLLIFYLWLKSWRNDSFCLWFSNFSINFLALLLDCRKRYSRYSVFLTLLLDCRKRYSRHSANRLMVPKMILRLFFCGSCRTYCEFDFCTTTWHSRSQANFLVELILCFHT